METDSVLSQYRAQTAQVFDDLVRDSLRILLPTTGIVVWTWVSFTILAVEARVGYGLAVLAVILTTVLGGYLLQKRHLHVAVSLYLVGLMAAVTIICVAVPTEGVLYLFIPVVLVTAVLTSPAVTWCVALLGTGLAVFVGVNVHALPPGSMVSPVILTLLTVLSSWLSSRRLFTALGWALAMTREAQKNAEEARERRAEVRKIVKSLEEASVRLERANQALIFAREAAEKAYRFKAEFVANVSHELRTPLNLIVGFSEMMATAPESYGGSLLPSEYRGDMMAIYRSARHLSDLIGDVLDLSQIEAGRLPLRREPASLNLIVDEATEIVRGLVEAKGLRLEVEMPEGLPSLRLDRTRIRQVLLNLLSNATRFTDRGWIRLRAYIEGDEVKVNVADSGLGIAQERIARAFEAFSQLGEQQAREGSGLGLAVSKSFVELHGGTMWIDSAPGKGTTVGFSLPIPDSGKEAPLTLVRTSAPAVQGTREPWVLVLHDDRHVVSLLDRYIESIHFVPTDTTDKAMEAVREGLPVAVLTDSSSGDLWTRVSAQVGKLAQLPVLSCPLPGLRRLGLLLGATDYLAKPVAREDLAAALARLPIEIRTVLVVDDDRRIVRLVGRMLAAIRPALRVLEASGGAEALEVARTQRPDLVLLDLLMPEISGYDFLEAIRRDDALAGMPVIIMSAKPVEQEAAPILGELRLQRAGGFTLTETVQLSEAVLTTLVQSAAAAPASG